MKHFSTAHALLITVHTSRPSQVVIDFTNLHFGVGTAARNLRRPSPKVDTNLLRAGGYPTTASPMTSLLRVAAEKAACTAVLAFAPELFDEMPYTMMMSKNAVTGFRHA
ncbi:hypothetical protein VPH35_027161 [Triticum aestivum]